MTSIKLSNHTYLHTYLHDIKLSFEEFCVQSDDCSSQPYTDFKTEAKKLIESMEDHYCIRFIEELKAECDAILKEDRERRSKMIENELRKFIEQHGRRHNTQSQPHLTNVELYSNLDNLKKLSIFNNINLHIVKAPTRCSTRIIKTHTDLINFFTPNSTIALYYIGITPSIFEPVTFIPCINPIMFRYYKIPS